MKFTPEGGTVSVKISCLGDAEVPPEGARNSMASKRSSQRTSRYQLHEGSGSNTPQVSRKASISGSGSKNSKGTALTINPMDPSATPRVQFRERSPTPPPPNAMTLMFQFEVSDTGPGIPAHLQEQVFEPFVQGDIGLSKKYGGTGLGLSICSQLASLMGGDISLASTEGVGSTFTMRIPLKHVRSRPPSTSSSDIYVGSRCGSISSTAPQDEQPRRTSGDGNPTAGVVAANSNKGYENGPQTRLVGLSQPFFASNRSPTPTTMKDSGGQLAALDSVHKESGTKLRVLVAEDNLVNQEVVLR